MNSHLAGASNPPDRLVTTATRFQSAGRVLDVQAHGKGNINDTYLVTVDTGKEAHFVLQRINTKIFCHPELIMANMRVVTEHVRQRLQAAPLPYGRRWDLPRVLLTRDGKDHWVDLDGSFWRAISFIDAAQSFDIVQGLEHAGEIGFALGMFHHLLRDLPSGELADTLVGFHLAPGYLRHFDQVLAGIRPRITPELRYALEFVEQRRDLVKVLEDAKAQGKLQPRTIHGDPKVNNIMMDTAAGQAVAMVDLDTVKPGLVHYDIGDCLRSGCNPLGENLEQWERVRFELELCRAVLRGYLSLGRGFLTEHDYAYLFAAIHLIPFELGLRFLTDHLEGDVYFKVSQPDDNLFRALGQFKLTESIEAQASAIQGIIQGLT
ncbi:MAG TPA: aminoglycoside phosphotransferase [Syntrophobacteraceae bacterium]|nr:aminoglycoside phosphotransferase [Syntrophobacteraceae bacterium]